MAASIPSSSTLTSVKNKTNYTRLCRLLTDIGTKVLREVLDSLHSPADLQKHLNSTSVVAKLQKLRRSKVLYTQQWDKLYPASGVPLSTSFDITLLFLVLRNTCGLTPPATGWKAPLSPSDFSKGADLIRVKQWRNEITGHSAVAELSDVEFEAKWAEIEAALLRLGGVKYQSDIQRLKIESMDPENEAFLNVLLQSWEEGEEKKFEVFKDEVKRLVQEHQEQLKNAQIKSEQPKPFCTLPQKPSHDTVYRHNDVTKVLEEIGRLRTTYPNHVTVTYLSGNPGCGKSELARQIGEKHSDEVDKEEFSKFVVTLNATNLETLIQSYIELANHLRCNEISHIMISENKSQDWKLAQLQAMVFPKVENYSSWLMIVDGVEDIQVMSKIIPQSGKKLTHGKGHILITTQDTQSIPTCDSHTHHFPLNRGMELQDAVQSLHTISGFSCDEKVTKQVCEKLDFQPLALACAAVYMRQIFNTDPTMNWERYIEEIEKGNKLFAEEFYEKTNSSYQRSMTTAVTMAVRKALEKSEVLRHTFEFMAVIAPQFISLKHVVNYVLLCMPELDRHSVEEAITSNSLIVTSKEESKELSIRVHQVVYRVLQQVYKTAFQQPVKEFSFFMKFASVFSYVNNMDETSFEFFVNTASLIQHFMCFSEKVIKYFKQHKILNFLNEGNLYGVHYETNKSFTHQYIPLATFLTNVVSSVCEEHFKHCTARMLLEISYCLIKTNYGDHDVKVAHALGNLGRVLYLLRANREAKECYEKALVIQQNTYGSNDSEVAKTLNNLGLVLSELVKLDKAKECYENALAIQQSTYGSKHPDVATTLNNLGSVLRDLVKYDEAKGCYEKALAIQESTYGSKHPDVATTLNNLGLVLTDLVKYDEAKECYEKALAIDESAYGRNHPELAKTLNNLGGVLRDLVKLDEAKECYEKSLAIQESTYGSNHPVVATTLNNLGVVLSDLVNLDEAKECFEKALAIQESTYGSNHPVVSTTLNNLGLVLSDLGKLDEAKEFFQKSLAIQESTYGSNHPVVATTLNNLVLVSLRDLVKLDEAKECLFYIR